LRDVIALIYFGDLWTSYWE